MTRNVIALATAAVISLGTVAPLQAMDNEHTQLMNAVIADLSRLDVDMSNIDSLTLGDIARLKQLLSGESISEAAQKNAVRRILEEAGRRR
jgi:Asp-tRNA(Asn)/Glu-tRNA(Gln) amidotransferase B subunit